MQLQHRHAQGVHPGGGFLAANAAGAVHGHALALRFPGGHLRLDPGRKVAEVTHLRIDRALEAAEPKLEAVAVVDQHHVVVRQQLAPGLRAELGADVADGFDPVHPQRQDLGLAVHLHALERRAGAAAALAGDAAEQAAQARVVRQRRLKCVERFGCAGQHAVDAFAGDEDAAFQFARQLAQGGGHRLHLDHPHELVEGVVSHVQRG